VSLCHGMLEDDQVILGRYHVLIAQANVRVGSKADSDQVRAGPVLGFQRGADTASNNAYTPMIATSVRTITLMTNTGKLL
jgi:hypothetical protein